MARKQKRICYMFGRIKVENLMQLSKSVKSLMDDDEKVVVLNIQKVPFLFFWHYYIAFYRREVSEDELSPYMRDSSPL